MEKVIEKLELFVDKFIDDLEKKPFKTIVKTFVIVWITVKIVKLIKSR